LPPWESGAEYCDRIFYFKEVFMSDCTQTWSNQDLVPKARDTFLSLPGSAYAPFVQDKVYLSRRLTDEKTRQEIIKLIGNLVIWVKQPSLPGQWKLQ
jgi:hypothetical protein